MQVNKITTGIANYINNSTKAQKSLKWASDNANFIGIGTSVALACVARPLTLLGVPMENKQDKRYSIASSMASGVTELLTAPLLFNPFKKAVNNSAKNIGGDLFIKTAKDASNYKSITNRAFKICAMPFVSLFRFATVTPLVKAVFGKG